MLNRYVETANKFKIDVVVRINSDCPLIDPKVVEKIIDAYLKNFKNYDYVSNILEPSFPLGFHVEVISREALCKADRLTSDPEEREHVTPFIYRNSNLFSLKNVKNNINLSHYRLTIDYSEDFFVIEKIFNELYSHNTNFTLQDIIRFLEKNPEIYDHNKKYLRQQILQA